MPNEYQPHYRWKLTWPDAEDDFTGFDGPNLFARFHLHHTHFWMWSVMAYFVLNQVSIAPTAGRAETAREAARAAEECYDRILAGTWTGMKPRDIERAAAVAARRDELWRDVLDY